MSKTHKITQLKKRIAELERKLQVLRSELLEYTELHQQMANNPNASNAGKHYDRGSASGAIHARAKLEELFDYWNNL